MWLLLNIFFYNLLEFCKNLTNLTLNRCTFTDFVSLPKLQKLHLSYTSQFQSSYLHIIFNEMNLINIKAEYLDCHIDFITINPLLQIFEYSDYENSKFICYTQSNLKDFHYNLEMVYENYHNFQLSTFCPNLENLYIPHLPFDIKDLLNLKYLRKIFLNTTRNFTLPKLIQLLELDSLRELSFGENSILMEVCIHSEYLKAFKTNVLYLSVPVELMNVLQNFLLDLLDINKQLTLMCHHLKDVQFVVNVLDNKRFPKRLHSIKFCGISIGNKGFYNFCKLNINLFILFFIFADCFAILTKNVEDMKRMELIMNAFVKLGLCGYFVLL